jgi:GxxExxY protein
METLQECSEDLIDKVLTAATKVHAELGPGLLESVYEKALLFELTDMGISAKNQVDVPVKYRNTELGLGFRADIIVENNLLLELKTVNEFSAIHLS